MAFRHNYIVVSLALVTMVALAACQPSFNTVKNLPPKPGANPQNQNQKNPPKTGTGTPPPTTNGSSGVASSCGPLATSSIHDVDMTVTQKTEGTATAEVKLTNGSTGFTYKTNLSGVNLTGGTISTGVPSVPRTWQAQCTDQSCSTVQFAVFFDDQVVAFQGIASSGSVATQIDSMQPAPAPPDPQDPTAVPLPKGRPLKWAIFSLTTKTHEFTGAMDCLSQGQGTN